MRGPGELCVEPPILPRERNNQEREQDIGGEEAEDRLARPERLIGFQPHRDDDQRRQHVAADGDDSPGRKAEAPFHGNNDYRTSRQPHSGGAELSQARANDRQLRRSPNFR